MLYKIDKNNSLCINNFHLFIQQTFVESLSMLTEQTPETQDPLERSKVLMTCWGEMFKPSATIQGNACN